MAQSEKNFSFLQTYIKGETLIGGWRLVGNGLTIANIALLLSILTVFDYGVYILIISFISFVSHLFLGFLHSVVLNDLARFIGEGKEEKAKRLFLENATVQLGLALITSVTVFFSADLVASWYDEDMASLIRITSPIFLINGLYLVMRMLFNARLRFGIVAGRPIVYKVLRFVFLLTFIFFGSLNVSQALTAHIAATFLATFIFIPAFINSYAPWRGVKAVHEWILWRITKTYGKWSIFGSGFKNSILDLKPWLIQFFVNTEAVAVYSVAESAYGALKQLLPARTLKVLFPRIVHDVDRIEKILLRSIKYLFLYSVFLGVFGAIVIPSFIRLAFPQYIESIPLFYVLLFALPFLSFRSPTIAFLTSLRRQRFIFVTGVVVSISALLLPLVLLPLFGVVGMAIERIIAAAIISVLIFWYLVQKKEIPLSMWKGIFQFDKHDRIFFVRFIYILRNQFHKLTKR